jgi:hypothetical protein
MEIIVIAVLIGLIPAFIAQKKGRSFVGWWIFGGALFIVALPVILMMKPLRGSESDLKNKVLRQTAAGFMPTRTATVDFVADGVIGATPYRNEPDGGVVANVNGQTIKFRSLNDLESMINASKVQ